MAIFLLAYVAIFRITLILEKLLPHTSSEYLLWHKSYFEQLFLQSRWIFWFFFLGAPFSEQSLLCSSFFRVKLLPSSYFVRIGSSLEKLLFEILTFLVEELFSMKISTEELLFRSRYFCKESTFWEELHFGKR